MRESSDVSDGSKGLVATDSSAYTAACTSEGEIANARSLDKPPSMAPPTGALDNLQDGHHAESEPMNEAPTDPRLAVVVERWPRLPKAVRASIAAIIKAATDDPQ
jgi:hypothetical protein